MDSSDKPAEPAPTPPAAPRRKKGKAKLKDAIRLDIDDTSAKESSPQDGQVLFVSESTIDTSARDSGLQDGSSLFISEEDNSRSPGLLDELFQGVRVAEEDSPRGPVLLESGGLRSGDEEVRPSRNRCSGSEMLKPQSAASGLHEAAAGVWLTFASSWFEEQAMKTSLADYIRARSLRSVWRMLYKTTDNCMEDKALEFFTGEFQRNMVAVQEAHASNDAFKIHTILRGMLTSFNIDNFGGELGCMFLRDLEKHETFAKLFPPSRNILAEFYDKLNSLKSMEVEGVACGAFAHEWISIGKKGYIGALGDKAKLKDRAEKMRAFLGALLNKLSNQYREYQVCTCILNVLHDRLESDFAWVSWKWPADTLRCRSCPAWWLDAGIQIYEMRNLGFLNKSRMEQYPGTFEYFEFIEMIGAHYMPKFCLELLELKGVLKAQMEMINWARAKIIGGTMTFLFGLITFGEQLLQQVRQSIG